MLYVLWRKTLCDDEGEPYGYFHIAPTDPEVTALAWELGQRLTLPLDGVLSLMVEADSEARFFADYVFGAIPLFSARFRKVLEDAGIANVDFDQTVLVNAQDYPLAPPYFAPCIVGVVPVVDDSASAISEQPFGGHGATSYSKLVVRSDLGQLPDIFRLRENTGTVVVSERIVEACTSAKLDTLRFVPLTEWVS